MSIKEIDKQFVANTYARFDLEIVRGQGSYVYDSEGKEYIDLSSGIAVNTFGMCDPVFIKAVNEQLNKVQHTSNLYYSEPCARLAEILCTRTGAKKVCLCRGLISKIKVKINTVSTHSHGMKVNFITHQADTEVQNLWGQGKSRVGKNISLSFQILSLHLSK